MISPGKVATFNFLPSRCFNSNENPVRASNKVIFFSMNKSAPFL